MVESINIIYHVKMKGKTGLIKLALTETKPKYNNGNNKITELRTILQRESPNSYLYKQTKSVNNRKTVKTVMTLT